MAVTADSSFSSGGGGDGHDDKVWPPGFRFHPTDEELVLYYLKRKIRKRKLKLDIIRETDVYKWDPEDLPGQSILKTGDRQWFFFSPRDRKYPNGARSNRATRQGYWKATGKDRSVACNSRNVGVKKTLVFYRGRAPNGERTDWVMHEYTLDDEELNRCPNVQDYYALYKVFKKSGPGPKNGEQYGAPFKEEDWADDECAGVNDLFTPDKPVKQHNEVTPVDNVQLLGSLNDLFTPDKPVKQHDEVTPVDDDQLLGELEPPLYELEDIMKPIAEEPSLGQPWNFVCSYKVPQVACEEEAQSTLVDPSSREVIFSEPVGELTTSCQQHDSQASFGLNHSATSKLQSQEAAEVTTTSTNSEHGPWFSEEDFLEIDDLIDQEPTLPNIEQPEGNLQCEGFDGFSELDLYHDAAMFLFDMGPVDQGTVPHSYMNSFVDDMVNQVGYQLQPISMGNQLDHQLQLHAVSNQVSDALQLQSSVAYPMSSQLLMDDQRSDLLTSSESNPGTYSQPTQGSGVVCEPNISTVTNENQDGKEVDGWFSSALWAFVESIPTTPASASETPLVNKAFERMSSFSRVRMTVKNTSVDAESGTVNIRRTGGNRGFIFLSVFGALFAVLWVLVGTVRVLWRSIY